jgi:predicted Rossmann-fold nucleotide-binding protein
VLVGTPHWAGLLEWARGTLLAGGAISEDDLALLQLTDDPDEVVRIIGAYSDGARDGPLAEDAERR